MSLSNEQKNKIRKMWNEFVETLPLRVEETPKNVVFDFFLSQFDTLQAEADNERLDELKLCKNCHTMKRFSTDMCFRCLDRNEAIQEVKEELKKKIEGMRQETCDCEEGIGYHSKECDFGPYGFNQALDEVLQILNKYEKDFT